MIHRNVKRADRDYQVSDNSMLVIKTTLKYEIPHKVPVEVRQC